MTVTLCQTVPMSIWLYDYKTKIVCITIRIPDCICYDIYVNDMILHRWVLRHGW